MWGWDANIPIMAYLLQAKKCDATEHGNGKKCIQMLVQTSSNELLGTFAMSQALTLKMKRLRSRERKYLVQDWPGHWDQHEAQFPVQSLTSSQRMTSPIKGRVEEGRQRKFFAKHMIINVGFITNSTVWDSGFLSTCSDAHIWKVYCSPHRVTFHVNTDSALSQLVSS